MSLKSFYHGKTVMVIGHTGFKGGWLSIWLESLGAKVVGLSLEPEGYPNMFEVAGVGGLVKSTIGDIRDLNVVKKFFRAHEPEVVFHLAAQPIVRRSYDDPVATYGTNVMGTVNVLEAVRHTPSVRVVIVVTSDKCYENKEWVYSYRENDPLGGYDPYSSSKAATELVVTSYRNSFFNEKFLKDHNVCLSSVRAGNIIGGGDWSAERIIPDCMRFLISDEKIAVRNPQAIRPWQHTLEPLAGYLWLGACMGKTPESYGGAWNFGPLHRSNAKVSDLVGLVIDEWGTGEWADVSQGEEEALHEAMMLKLDCTKAANRLGWWPVLSLEESVGLTTRWYKEYYNQGSFDAWDYTCRQIDQYVSKAKKANVLWAKGL